MNAHSDEFRAGKLALIDQYKESSNMFLYIYNYVLVVYILATVK